jgi:serine protease AprX
MPEAEKPSGRRRRPPASQRAPSAPSGPTTDIPQPIDRHGRLSVLVELRAPPGMSAIFAAAKLRQFSAGGFALDAEFQPVPMHRVDFGLIEPPASYVVRATVESEAALPELARLPDVAGVWRDTPIDHFQCPIEPCDCDPNTPHGTIADVATYLGVSDIWVRGFRGSGIVVGIVDGGITAQGRPVKDGETDRRIPRVIGGWPTGDWGTEASAWGEHGNMTSTDALGMAPEAHLYDLRISGGDIPGTISRALQAFQWAIDQHRLDGTPHILSNSWGIFQEAWDPEYATNADHPFTRKVVEALDEDIVVLFAAGNCGEACADNRCGDDTGQGRSIWGANSHPRVMTVGAVNIDGEFVGYSSQGPGALDANKPDFCSVTHFTGYFDSDSGTSAATPILAGAAALLKQAHPAAAQDAIKAALSETALDIGPAGWDVHSGAGIVRVMGAFDRLEAIPAQWFEPVLHMMMS